jgi:AAA ATPase domain
MNEKTRPDRWRRMSEDSVGFSKMRLPFPWSDGEGLTAPLCDPALWTEVFEESRDRAAVKRAARKSRVDDGEIGELAVVLLMSKQGRANLADELKQNAKRQGLLPKGIVAAKLERILKRRGVVLPATLFGGAPGSRAGLDIVALERRPDSLQRLEPTDVLRALSIYAMRQLHRERIVAVMQDYPLIASVLELEAKPALDLAKASEKLAVEAGEVIEPQDSSEKDPEPGNKVDTDSGFDAHRLLVTSPPPRLATLRSLRQQRESLSRELEMIDGHISAIDRRQARIHAQHSDLRTKEWLRPCVPSDINANVDEGELIFVAEARLQTLESVISDVSMLCAQIEDLGDRIDGSRPVAPRGSTNLAGLRAWLGQQIDALDLRVRELAENEARIQRLLEELSYATLDSCKRITTTLTRDIVLLGQVLAGDRTCLGRQTKLKDLSTSRQCLGFLIATVVHLSVTDALPLANVIGQRIETGEDVGDLVEFLSPPWWEPIVREVPPLAFPFVARAIAAAIVSEDGTGIDYVSQCLDVRAVHKGLRDFLEAVRDAHHRGELAGIREALGGAAANERRAADAARARQRVLEAIQRHPGMTGNYHKLRVEARARYLLPLQASISANDPDAVFSQWRALGSLEDMVQQTHRSFERGGGVTDSHLDQLTNYLREFDSLLHSWKRLATPSTPAALRQVSNAWHGLAEEARKQCVGPVATFARVIREAISWNGLISAGASAYLNPPLCMEDGGAYVLAMPSPIINARMTWSFAQGIEHGAVDLAVLLVGTLRAEIPTLAVPSFTYPEAIRLYLEHAKWEVARAAAGGDPELENLVAAFMEERREELRTVHGDLLRAAEDAKDDEYVSIALSYVLEALKELNSDKLSRTIEDLENQLRRFRLQQDPRRSALAEFVREAGEPVGVDDTIDQLAVRVERLRRAAGDRRFHIDQLLGLADTLPNTLKEAWHSAARRLDRPALWPTRTRALELADTIDIFKEYLEAQAEEDPATVGLLMSRFEAWLPPQLSLALQHGGDEAAKPFIGLGRDIKRFASITKVLRLLGESTVPRRTSASAIDAARSMGASAPALQQAARLVSDIRKSLLEVLETVDKTTSVTDDGLQRLVSSEDWHEVLVKAGAGVHVQTAREERFSGREALCLVALARMSEASISAYTAGALAVVGNTDAEYWIRTDIRTRYLVDSIAIIAGAEPAKSSSPAEVLTTALERLRHLPGSHPTIGHVTQLFSRLGAFAIRGQSHSVLMASILWDVFKGAQRNAEPRSHLLSLLYRMRQYEAIKRLSAEAKPFDMEIYQCVIAFDRSESAPEVRPRTLQISAAIRERIKGRNKPWTLLFAQLEAGFATDDPGQPFEARLVSSVVDIADDQRVMLQVQLCPPPQDAPLRLLIEVGDAAHPLLQDDEPLLKERTVAFAVDSRLVGPTDVESRLPYRITGHTIRGNRIDVRGVWTPITRRVERIERITQSDIQRAWPGAKGDPLPPKDPLLFGRDRELKLLRAQLTEGDRPQSVMIFGQRRVGKTSLLWQMVDMLPPRRGAVAGAFVDVSGVDLGSGSFAKALVTHICAALDNDPRNEPIRKALHRYNDKIEISKLLRGLEVDNVFFAFEALVERLRDLSHGEIYQLAIFVDEFDRFVEPLLSGRGAEVDKLLWQLRQVAQQSHKVALILAGSGLQRLLTDDYNKPLFASIAQLDVGPFRLEALDGLNERQAIESTFLPVSVRDRLCRPEDLEGLVETACELTGGYPYYLAMLGYSAALTSIGKLSPASLHRTVDEMVRCGVPNLTWRIEAHNFYSHVFETASRLSGERPSAVKLLLSFIAAQTSLDYPWLSRGDIDAADIMASEFDRHEALAFLEKEHVIEIDRKSSRVRISVPITAAAVREDALMIREEALAEKRRVEADT